ncbi:putative reverse transcriptase domain-containing protein [Tanacetum coccineum]
MSPPIRRKYHDSVAFATGCKRIKNSKRCNRKIRIPIAMWPCRVEEKMTLKEVDGQTVEEIETKIIAKDGTITRVPGKFQGNDLTAYTQRFQELILLCSRIIPDEEDRVERFIGGLPDNIQGNGYVARSIENKRRIESNPSDNHGQQPPNVSGLNVAKAYTVDSNEKRGSTAAVPNTQRALFRNQQGVICYECGRPGHVKRDCPKLRNQNHGIIVGNKTGNKIGNNKATVRAYAIGGGGANPDSNVFMGTFLLNNYYASMLFDSGADRSFVSSTFSALLDVAPSALDTSYAVEFLKQILSLGDVH